MKIKRILSAATAAMILNCTYFPTAPSADIDTAYSASEEQIYSVDKDNFRNKGIDENGLTYNVYLELTFDTEENPNGSMTFRDDGTIGVEWDSTAKSAWFEADYGYEYEQKTNALEMGEISIDYDAEQELSPGRENRNARLGVHGLLNSVSSNNGLYSPLCEFYIIDNWENWRPSETKMETVVIDGAEYDIFRKDHPSSTYVLTPKGFSQYFSVRKEPRKSGTINVSEHFKAWEDMGWDVGELSSVNFNVAGCESKGSAEIKSLKINAPMPVTTTAATTTAETTASTTASTTEESTTTTSVTTTTDIFAGDDKTYTEVVNTYGGSRIDIIPPYTFYSNTKNGHMYSAENGCFAAITDASEV